MTRLLRSDVTSVVPTLIASGDAFTASVLQRELGLLGLEVRSTTTFPEAKAAVTSGAYGVALVDVAMPGGDGFELIRAVRSSGLSMALVLVSARNDVAARVHGLDCGADDCVTLPMHGDELRARVKALLRRQTPGPVMRSERVTLGARWFDRTTGVAQTNVGQVVLSKRELLLMRRFVEREGELLTRNDLLDAAWGLEACPTDRTIDNFIVRLRRYFEPNPAEPTLLVTVRGRGYCFQRLLAP
ncbi:MAG: response regulator transcription factor [Myxococcaceae bacterium]|jgi:DNA-binding response OmpR family regulator|nr:response regulator transcription factor [Myxococcaceae bacterium]